jgi:signal transduction histidine kinase
MLMTSGLKKDLEKHYIESNSQKASSFANQIIHYIEERHIELETQTKNKMLQKNLIQAKPNIHRLNEHLDSQNIIGKKYSQTIINTEGKVIAQTEGFTSIDTHQTKIDTHNLASSFQTPHDSNTLNVRLSPDKHYWQLISPIFNHQSIQGVLLTYIPLKELESELNLNQLRSISIRITMKSGRSITWGEQSNGHWKQIPDDEPALDIFFSSDLSSLNESFSAAENQLILGSLLIACVAIFLSFFIGHWFFVRPIERLQKFAKDISTDSKTHLSREKYITTELQSLADQIFDMAKKIQQRESSLIQSNVELKNNQKSLVHSEKMAGLGQVTAGVAHEINNPICFIMNNLCMLKEYNFFSRKLILELITLKNNLSEDEAAKHSKLLTQIADTLALEDLDFVLNDIDCICEESLNGAERVKEITQGLKGYAYSDESITNVNINECVESTLRLMWNELKYNCSLEKTLTDIPDLPCVSGHINQLLLNIFVNASYAMNDIEGKLKIKTYATNDSINIEISDNGKGIEETNLTHIFEPFFTTKPVGHGTGLGMSICYDIVKQYQGDIFVSSKVGVGTTFRISFPILGPRIEP